MARHLTLPCAMKHRLPFLALLAVSIAIAACSSPGPTAKGEPAEAAAVKPALRAPTMADTKALDVPGVHNIVAYAPGVFSGSVPEGAKGFDSLAAMGIKTVISVDGATPDLAEARKHGMRYIHLPIGYDTVPEDRAKALAQALASVDGPVYMHCHHGKHRSAAAASVACIATGRTTPEEATRRMKEISGTTANYSGLYAVVQATKPMDKDSLRIDPSTLPEVTKVSGLVATMVELDVVFDNLKALNGAEWQVPKDHPDLVPAKEARRAATLFRGLHDDAESNAYPADYQQWLNRSIEDADAIAKAVDAGDAKEAALRFQSLGKTCKECHKPYRDQ